MDAWYASAGSQVARGGFLVHPLSSETRGREGMQDANTLAPHDASFAVRRRPGWEGVIGSRLSAVSRNHIASPLALLRLPLSVWLLVGRAQSRGCVPRFALPAKRYELLSWFEV